MTGSPSWRNVVVLSATILFTLTGVFSWLKLTPNYLRELKASPELIGWCFFGFTVAARVPALLGGWLADRFGRKTTLVVCTLGMGACFIAVALARTPLQVTAAMAAVWTLGAVQWPALLTLVADSVPFHLRGRALGSLEMCAMGGTILGPLAGALVYDATGGGSLGPSWRILLFATFGIYTAVGIARWLFVRETLGAADVEGREPMDLRRILLPVVVITLAAFAAHQTQDGPAPSLFITDDTGGTARTVNLVNFVGGIVALGAAFLGGWMADRAGAGRTILLSLLGQGAIWSAFAIPGFGAAHGRALFVLAMIPVELFSVAYQKLITTAAPRGRRGMYVGISAASTGLISSWSLVLCGNWYDRSHTLPFVVGGGIFLGTALLSLPLLRKTHN